MTAGADERPLASRGGLKLAHGLDALGVSPVRRVCADLGCSTGGFTDVLLRRGARRVYAVDTGYGVLAWRLRSDDRVVVMERTNAMHARLPEPASLVVIDAGWTRQAKLLPNVDRLLARGGDVVTLVKPHYEAARDEVPPGGVLAEDRLPPVLEGVRRDVAAAGFVVVGEARSPIRGSSKRSSQGNAEFLWHLRRR